MAERSRALPVAAWRETRVAEGSLGPRVYRFSAQRGAGNQEAEAW